MQAEATRPITRSESVGNAAAKAECRVLMVFDTLGLGGAETWLTAILRYLKEHAGELPIRLKIDVCLTGHSGGTFDAEAVAMGARLIRLPYGRKTVWSFMRGFRLLLAKGQYHAVHDQQDYTAGWHFLFGCGRLPAVRVVHVHNPAINLQFFATSLLRRLTWNIGRRLVAAFATHIMGTSLQVVEDYGFNRRAFRHVVRGALHCGFDVARFQSDRLRSHAEVCAEFGWEPSIKILLFAGRLSSNCNQKNPQFAIDVAAACIARDPMVRLLMAGGGDEVIACLRQGVAERGLERQISFLGERHDIPWLMSGADLFLFPSVAEGLGMVAVEAQAAGLPVLASTAVPQECTVVREMVHFLSLDESPAAWAEAAACILRAERPAHETCNAAVRRSTFSIETSVRQLLRLYQTQPFTTSL